MSRSSLAIVAIALCLGVTAVNAFMPHLNARMFEARQQMLAAHAEMKGIKDSDMPTAYFHTQQLDHFENGNGQSM